MGADNYVHFLETVMSLYWKSEDNPLIELISHLMLIYFFPERANMAIKYGMHGRD